jgi:6-oxo-cyclohex-1-ene-carbonyl-CoA hydrolase
MRIAGGQEIGMACDFTLAADTAVFGQAGPKHGSAPDGGSTDFLDLYVGINRAVESCTLCRHWSAVEAVSLGLINKVVPVLKDPEGRFIPSPFVHREERDEWGNPVYGRLKTGEEKKQAREVAEKCQVDLSRLDEEVNRLAYDLAMTMPDCLAKTIESVRKKKLTPWLRNSETNRSWLALNMMTEARAGFRAFNEGPKHNREVDFIKLRRALAQATPWTDELTESILPRE